MLELRDALLPWDYKSFTLVAGTDWRQRTDLPSRVINKVEQEVRRYINKYGEGKLERIGIDFHELETVDWVDSFKACINEEFVKRLYHLTVTMRDLLISKAGVKGALWIPKLWSDISYAWTSVCQLKRINKGQIFNCSKPNEVSKVKVASRCISSFKHGLENVLIYYGINPAEL